MAQQEVAADKMTAKQSLTYSTGAEKAQGGQSHTEWVKSPPLSSETSGVKIQYTHNINNRIDKLGIGYLLQHEQSIQDS